MADSSTTWSRLQARLGSGRVQWMAAIGAVPLIAVLAIAGAVALHLNRQEAEVDLLQRPVTSPRDLDSVHSAFAQEGLSEYRVVDGRILVPRRRRADYWQALQKHQALPRQFYENSREALESGGLFTTFQEKQRRLDMARERDVALAIEQIPSVEKALVLYDELETGGLAPRRLVTAMVSICCREDEQLTLPQVEMIRTMVADAKAGLRPEDVDVSDLRSGRVYSAGQPADQAAQLAASYLQLKKQLEQHWHDRIVQLLDDIPGARVTVSVALPKVPSEYSGSGERVRVAVRIPRSYLQRLLAAAGTSAADRAEWGRMQQRLAAQVQRTVAAILPESTVPLQEQVAVALFNDAPLVPPAAASPGWQRLLPASAGPLRRELVAGGAVAVALLLLVGLYARNARRPAAARQPLDRIRRMNTAPRRPDRAPRTDPLAGGTVDDEDPSREALIQLVRQDPDRAARVLNDWIRQAG